MVAVKPSASVYQEIMVGASHRQTAGAPAPADWLGWFSPGAWGPVLPPRGPAARFNESDPRLLLPRALGWGLAHSLEGGGRAAARVVPGATAGAVAVSGRRMVAALASPAGVICRQALDDAIAGEHAAIDGKVAANHKGTHGCVFLGQAAGLVCEIRLILAAIDQDQAGVAIGAAVALIAGVMPPTAPAKACKKLR